MNLDKTKEFYKLLKDIFALDILERYFGKEDEFIESLNIVLNEIENIDSRDNIVVAFKNNLSISFDCPLVKKLFVTPEGHVFDKSIDETINSLQGDFIYIRFKESENIIISNKLGKKLIPISPISPDEEFIFINPKTENDHYPDELLEYFILTMQKRFITTLDIEEKLYVFYHFFKPINYLVRIKRSSLKIEAIKYYLAKNLGILPVQEEKLSLSNFEVSQILSQIYDDTNNKFSIDDYEKKTEAIYYYLKSLHEKDPLYQFLNFYHVIETYCYAYMIEYIERQVQNDEAYNVFSNLKKKINEDIQLIITTVFILNLKYNTEFINFKNQIDCINTEFESFINGLNNNLREGDKIQQYKKWGKNIDIFPNSIGKFIFKIRCEIAHRKIQKNPITVYSKDYPNAVKVTNSIMKRIAELIIEDKDIK